MQQELNLVASLSLLDDFSVSMLPVQVRLCENRLDIVRAVLDSSPTAYRKHDKVGGGFSGRNLVSVCRKGGIGIYGICTTEGRRQKSRRDRTE